MCFDVSIPIRLICSTDGSLCLRSQRPHSGTLDAVGGRPLQQMNRGETTQGLGNPGENADSYFHPLLGSFSPAQTGQATAIKGTSSFSTKKWQSHLANPGLNDLSKVAAAVGANGSGELVLVASPGRALSIKLRSPDL